MFTTLRNCLVVSSAVIIWLTAATHRIFNHKQLWSKIFHVKISDNASFSLWLFVFVHVPPIFSALSTYSLKINSLLYWATLYTTTTTTTTTSNSSSSSPLLYCVTRQKACDKIVTFESVLTFNTTIMELDIIICLVWPLLTVSHVNDLTAQCCY